MMKNARKTRMALMAGASLTAASALAPVQAVGIDAAAYPAIVETPAVPNLAHAADHADRKAPLAAKQLALFALAAGALAGLVRLIGVRKISRAVSKGASATSKAVGRVLGGPIRFIGFLACLTLIAFLGVGFYDWQWIAGLLLGATLTATVLYGAAKLRRVVNRIPVKRE